MPGLGKPLKQLAIVVALGASVGWIYRRHRAGEVAWSSTHYRLDETIALPTAKGLPFREPFLVDARGERIVVPLEGGQELDLGGATWWNVDGTGRMRIWNEDRVEVFPTLRSE